MTRDGQNDTVQKSEDCHKNNNGSSLFLKPLTPRARGNSHGKKDKQKTNNGNSIINTRRKISVQNSLLPVDTSRTLIPNKRQKNNGNDIINNMRRPGTSSGGRHKNNDYSIFLPHGRSDANSMVKLVKSARGSSHDKSDTQTNNGNGIINLRVNTRRKISVQNSLLGTSGTLVPNKRQKNNVNGIINHMRRPGTRSGGRNKNNDDSMFLPHDRSGASSVMKLITKRARGSSHDKSDTQTNNDSAIIVSPRVNRSRKASVRKNVVIDSCMDLGIQKRGRKNSSLTLARKKYYNFKSLVNFVVKQNQERIHLLELVMTPFKVCSSLIIRLEFVAYPPFTICNFVGPDTNGERFSV